MLQVLRGLLLAGFAAAAAVFPLQSHTTAAPYGAQVPAHVLRGFESHAYSERQDQTGEVTVIAWTDRVNAALAQAEAQRKAEEEARKKAEASAAAAAAAAAAVRAQAQTPAAAPAPAPARDYGSGSIQDMIRQVFAPYGPAAVEWGLRVAACESGFNPRAYNASGPYYGLFQFSKSTFENTVYGNQDIWDPFYNASAAAWKYSVSGGGAWGCK